MRYRISMDPHRPPFRRRRLPGFNYADSDHAYFVTIRAKPSTAPFTDPRLAEVVIASLEWLRANREVRIYAYCLMPDHLHLLLQLSGNETSLGTIIGACKRFTTRQSWGLGYEGALWQGRFYDHIVRRSEEGERIVVYILANPVRKGLVAEPSEYPYSGMPDPI